MNQPDNSNTAQNPVGRFMVAIGAVIEHKKTGKILVLKRAPTLDWRPGEWEIDYGRIAQFEGPEEGLKREVLEETGIQDLQVQGMLRVWHIYRGPKAAENDLIGITYVCSTSQDEAVLSDEHSEWKWVTPQEALELITEEGIKVDINKYMEFTQV